MNGRIKHWTYFLFVFLLTFSSGVILIPLLRKYPESVHKFIIGLHDWQRIGFCFSLSVLFTYLMFKLFSPRIRHLGYIFKYPPTWFACFLGIVAVGGIDIGMELGPDGYTVSVGEWIGYGLGAFILVSIYCNVSGWKPKQNTKPKIRQKKAKKPKVKKDSAKPEWSKIESWLLSDSPSEHDFFGRQRIAHRLAKLILNGTPSVGIVGPFGSGKSSIVKWIKEKLENPEHSENAKQIFLCELSCWGFENSTTSIHEMLQRALETLHEKIDTFHLRSLPDSYRSSFSAGGKWVDQIAKLVFSKPSPHAQFAKLSELLGNINATLVFVVEDLDRNNSKSFDIQEVLGFLQRLKQFENLSFILTGGAESTSRIDFAKLCAHIEPLAAVSPRDSSRLVSSLQQYCVSSENFPYHPFGKDESDQLFNELTELTELTELITRGFRELSLGQSVAFLLSTPRALRHSLGRTFGAWKDMYGEIHFIHLFLVNVLRFGAPEAFDFLLRRYDQIRWDSDVSTDYRQTKLLKYRELIVDDWNNSVRNVTWDEAVARKVIEHIIPKSEYWLTDEETRSYSENHPQGVDELKYWLRAVNEELPPIKLRDQTVLKDLIEWGEDPKPDKKLISELTTDDQYGEVWEEVAENYFNKDEEKVLLLCEHVQNVIQAEHGAKASSNCIGFQRTCRFAKRAVEMNSENGEWIKKRISEALESSLELANSILYEFVYAGSYHLIPREDWDSIRLFMIEEFKQKITDSEILASRSHLDFPYTLKQLVINTETNSPVPFPDRKSWKWLGPILSDAIEKKHTHVAIALTWLLYPRGKIDESTFFELFSTGYHSLIQCMKPLAYEVAGEDRVRIQSFSEAASAVIDERDKK